MALPNPMGVSGSSGPVSMKTFYVGGIITDVYGLDELSSSCKAVSCLWLLHPRGLNKQWMADTASSSIKDWNQRPQASKRGLLAVSFDQRNHGSREVHAPANGAWIEGNESHAQDMFSIIQGTVVDTSLLIDHIGSYILLDENDPSIDQHLALGVSLGGHAAWQCLFGEPRITAAVVIIGCPDYMFLISDRARLSKLASHGANFHGSKHFPKALVQSVEKVDPKGILFGTSEVILSPSESQRSQLRRIMDQKIKNKRVLVCSGGEDKLVPYRCSEPFMKFLKNAAGDKRGEGWYKDGNVYVEDVVYPGAGHEYTDAMKVDSVRFISDTLAEMTGTLDSKI